MINYMLQVVLFQLLFLAIYEAFLKRETFFHWNRFYLLFSAVLSYVIPFARIQLFKNYVPEQLAISNLNNLNFTTIATETPSDIVTKTNYFTLENLYYAGVVIMLLLFVVKLLQLLNKILVNKVLRKPNYKLVILKKEDNAFSFMDYIFLGNTLFKKEHQHILQHELVHVKEKHSLDLLFFEIQKILFWFNPLVYVYQYKISVLHEYIADQKTLKTTEKQSFYENLLLQTFAIEKLPFVNQYSKKSLLKKRIIMATKNKSNQLLKMKYLLVLPVIFFMLIVASCDNENSTSQQETEEVQPFSIIKKVPVFPGCENAETNKEKKKCFTTNMQKFVVQNFNVDLAQTLNLPEGIKRIAVQFIIDKQGNASDIKVRAPHPKLKEEVIRMISKLPKMQPAEAENGKKVKVRYNLPIVFKVEDDASKNTKSTLKPPSPIAPPSPITSPGSKNIPSNENFLVTRISNEFGYLILKKEFLKKNTINAYSFKTKKQYKVSSFNIQFPDNTKYHIDDDVITSDVYSKIEKLNDREKISIKDITVNGLKGYNTQPLYVRIKDI